MVDFALVRVLLTLSLLAPMIRARSAVGQIAQQPGGGSYVLPDPLVFADGRAVRSAAEWKSRRMEILDLFEQNVYGRTPDAARRVPLRAEVDEIDRHALGGKAIRKQITLYFSDRLGAGPREHLLLYLPAGRHGRVPVVLGINFLGNHTVVADSGIELNATWSHPAGESELPRLTTPDAKSRGSQTEQWQVEKILSHGYGFATIYYGDIEPDAKGSVQLGVRPLFYAPGQTAPAADDWGALGAWAWGLSRAMDYLQSDRQVDGAHVAVTGHSRLGKAADWAAAQDERFAAVLSTESGKGGQSIYRTGVGEPIAHLEESFPYWFCGNFTRWVGRDAEIPVDGNLLLALVAPRLLYVASAEGDPWSDPHGEFASAVDASRVYRLLGRQGLVAASMPEADHPVDAPVQHDVGYHMRSGKHDVTEYDWEQYLRFLDWHWSRVR